MKISGMTKGFLIGNGTERDGCWLSTLRGSGPLGTTR